VRVAGVFFWASGLCPVSSGSPLVSQGRRWSGSPRLSTSRVATCRLGALGSRSVCAITALSIQLWPSGRAQRAIPALLPGVSVRRQLSKGFRSGGPLGAVLTMPGVAVRADVGAACAVCCVSQGPATPWLAGRGRIPNIRTMRDWSGRCTQNCSGEKGWSENKRPHCVMRWCSVRNEEKKTPR